MCTCNAFTYRSCKHGHCKFESVDVCLAARLGLREKCQERIINGHPQMVRAWPTIDGICDVCHPKEAKAEQEAIKKAEEEAKLKAAEEIKKKAEEEAKKKEEEKAKKAEEKAKEKKTSTSYTDFASIPQAARYTGGIDRPGNFYTYN